MPRELPPNYQPSPQPNTIFSGPVDTNGMPTAYDDNWQYFTNLTPNQVLWYQSQPEWQNFRSYVALSPSTASPATPVAVVNAALQVAGRPIAVNPLPSPLQPLIVR